MQAWKSPIHISECQTDFCIQHSNIRQGKIIPDGSCHVLLETTVRACNNTREQDLAFKMSAVGGVLLNLYFVKLLFQFTKVVIFIVIKITFKFKLPKLNILENNRLSSLSLRRVLCEEWGQEMKIFKDHLVSICHVPHLIVRTPDIKRTFFVWNIEKQNLNLLYFIFYIKYLYVLLCEYVESSRRKDSIFASVCGLDRSLQQIEYI